LSGTHKPFVGQDRPEYAVFCGVDVGKSDHHACALDPSGKRLHDKPLPNDEAALTGVLSQLTQHGRVLVVVDQPAAIGALTIAVARSLGIDVGYLPGLAMRRIADLYPGEGKTDLLTELLAHRRRSEPHRVPPDLATACPTERDRAGFRAVACTTPGQDVGIPPIAAAQPLLRALFDL